MLIDTLISCCNLDDWSERRLRREIDRCIGAVSAVVWISYRSVVIKRELNWNAKLSICHSIYGPVVISFG